MVGDFFRSCRKPALGEAAALSMTSITILSTLVYGHHMFTTQMSPLPQTFMTLTMTISIPSAIFFANWLGTIWKDLFDLLHDDFLSWCCLRFWLGV